MLGLIPAHAGKTRRMVGHCEALGAHPRSRGENPAQARARRARDGSSPLTRGKHVMQDAELTGWRLIPAHAGKTIFYLCPRGLGTAHPRSRGENGHSKGTPKCTPGSSPLTRGKRSRSVYPTWLQRLIPAHAGKTSSSQAGGPRYRAHPRSRGENATPAVPR